MSNSKINSQKTLYSGKSYDYYSNQCLNGMDNNNINWHNRPAFQSIVAVSEKLDAMNAAYYNGANAPDTIFYDNLSVDNRNPLWDDPQCKWAIFTHYKYLFTDSLHQLVLEKRPVSLQKRKLLLMDTVITFNQQITIPQNEKGIITLNAQVDANWKGNLRATLFQPPHIDLVLRHYGNNKTGVVDTFRYCHNLFNKQDLIINYATGICDNIDAAFNSNKLDIELFTKFNSIQSNIKSFSFQNDMPSGTSSKIRILIYKITLD
ncbi:hypothetical protein [Parasediminibacterium sp. JCM 36343]|uniref:hypothetical protein n=1 Tax=Parasediminibacterium sp. JCM 36343 TaxID=3374279 RepID=UPI00397B21FC